MQQRENFCPWTFGTYLCEAFGHKLEAKYLEILKSLCFYKLLPNALVGIWSSHLFGFYPIRVGNRIRDPPYGTLQIQTVSS